MTRETGALLGCRAAASSAPGPTPNELPVWRRRQDGRGCFWAPAGPTCEKRPHWRTRSTNIGDAKPSPMSRQTRSSGSQSFRLPDPGKWARHADGAGQVGRTARRLGARNGMDKNGGWCSARRPRGPKCASTPAAGRKFRASRNCQTKAVPALQGNKDKDPRFFSHGSWLRPAAPGFSAAQMARRAAR